MKKIKKNLFLELYPWDHTPTYRWRSVIFFGLFVFLFLLIFQPFGLDGNVPDKIIVFLGYGLITSFGVWMFNSVVPRVFPTFFREEKWYLWKEILTTMLAITFIALLNLLYSNFLNFFHLTFWNYLKFIGITLALGIFPVTISILLSYFFALRKNQLAAAPYHEELKSTGQVDPTGSIQLTLQNEEGDLLGKWPLDQILRVEAAQNYVELFALNSSGNPERSLLRLPLKEVENQIANYPQLIRTHRSHIVNLDRVTDVSGNAQGLQLELVDSDELIPVSRSRIPDFRKQFEQIHGV